MSDRMESQVPALRVVNRNPADIRGDGDYVLYWMIANRRVRWNFALDRAVDWARHLGKPLLVLEALRCDYRWASDRLHRFVLDGMADNRRALRDSGIGYHAYVEPEREAGRGLLASLAARAAVVVTDEFPCFFLPRMVEAAASRLDVRLEAVDANGLLPLAAADRAFVRAFDFRRFLQRELPDHLTEAPRPDPPRHGELPAFLQVSDEVRRRWPEASEGLLSGTAGLAALPIDHAVAPVPSRGGSEAGERALGLFLERRIDRYAEERNHPDAGAASELSAYLHFGHLSVHRVLHAIAQREEWSPWRLSGDTVGRRQGWWGLPESPEAFLDELVTWRELGYVFCARRPDDYADYGSLPDWARVTLDAHAADRRPHVYSLEELEGAATHDEIWNAAQRELRMRGRIHNYLRMLWGKKILHWSPSPRQALDVMIELNNKYAIDGRNPNSYSGILWVLGRFDRAWGPEREIFGKVRYMSSRNTRRKLRLNAYLERWSVSGARGEGLLA